MDPGAQTLANFLKFYNRSLVGGSLGHHIGEVRLLCYIVCSYIIYCIAYTMS